MKINYLLVCVFLISWMSQSQIVSIPDANFKFALVNYMVVDTDNDGIPDADVDTNNDGEIQVSEALATESLYPRGSAISSLEGVEAFVNLKVLNCSQNAISQLDLSQNPALEILACFFNNLSELDLNGLTQLKEVSCDFNDLSQLDLSQNTNLEYLRFAYNNLTQIDLSQNLLLDRLDGDSNNLTAIDLSANTNLTSISLDRNEIESLDLSQNPLIDFLDVNTNPLGHLDLSQNPMLAKFWAFNSGLTSLNLQNGNNTQLVILNVEGNSDLACIQVDDTAFANNQSNWAKDEIAIYSEDCLLGIGESSLHDLELYPNPAHEIVYLSKGNSILFEHVEIFNIQGQSIMKEFNVSNSLDISGLPRGVFYLQFTSETVSLTKKVIKE